MIILPNAGCDIDVRGVLVYDYFRSKMKTLLLKVLQRHLEMDLDVDTVFKFEEELVHVPSL